MSTALRATAGCTSTLFQAHVVKLYCHFTPHPPIGLHLCSKRPFFVGFRSLFPLPVVET